MAAGARSYRHVESIFEAWPRSSRADESTRATSQLPLVHGNVRGRGYYQVNVQ